MSAYIAKPEYKKVMEIMPGEKQKLKVQVADTSRAWTLEVKPNKIILSSKICLDNNTKLIWALIFSWHDLLDYWIESLNIYSNQFVTGPAEHWTSPLQVYKS